VALSVRLPLPIPQMRSADSRNEGQHGHSDSPEHPSLQVAQLFDFLLEARETDQLLSMKQLDAGLPAIPAPRYKIQIRPRTGSLFFKPTTDLIGLIGNANVAPEGVND